MLIDTHCHLDFEQFDADRDAIMARAHAAGVRAVVIPSVDSRSTQRALTLIDASPTHEIALFAAVGVHPNSTAELTEDALAQIEAFAGHPHVVAIGEIGLDYHWDDSPKATQWHWFEQQLELAGRLELPVIIHNREASDDVMRMLEQWARTLPASMRTRPGVMHSFSADRSIAERALACGFMLGFTGPITYKNADETRHVAGTMPLEQMLIETDAPFLTPVPHRGKRNEPAYARLVAERLAALRGLSVDEISRITSDNAQRLFNIKIGA